MSKIKKRADSRNADEEDDSQASLSVRRWSILPVCLGGASKPSRSTSPTAATSTTFLMGTKGLRKFHVAVDPSERFAAGKPNCSGQ
jgi:hypothetical protein